MSRQACVVSDPDEWFRIHQKEVMYCERLLMRMHKRCCPTIRVLNVEGCRGCKQAVKGYKVNRKAVQGMVGHKDMGSERMFVARAERAGALLMNRIRALGLRPRDVAVEAGFDVGPFMERLYGRRRYFTEDELARIDEAIEQLRGGGSCSGG